MASVLRSPGQTTYHPKTALRVFWLWHWLSESQGLSLANLQQRFATLDGFKPSQDTVQVYLNTLRRFGCVVEQTDLSDSRYWQITRQQAWLFAICPMWQERQAQALLDWLIMEEQALSRELGQLMLWAGWTPCLPPLSPLASALQAAIRAGNLVRLEYQSKTDAQPESFPFLPQRIVRQQRHWYIRGMRPVYQEASFLRLDRIVDVSPLDTQEPLRRQLAQLLRFQPYVQIVFPHTLPEHLDWPQSGDELPTTIEPYADGCRLTLETRDFFFLTQTLLSLGEPFQVVQPEAYARQMQEQINRLLKHHA